VISCHFPDGESFSLGTGSKPSKFEEYLSALRSLRDFNDAVAARGDADEAIVAECEVLLLSLNSGRLGDIDRLLRENLGSTYRSLAIKGSSPVCPESGPRTGMRLLAPISECQAELWEFVASWDGTRNLKILDLPLCVFSGLEAYGWSARGAMSSVLISSNFLDKNSVGNDWVANSSHDENPYRWLCRECSLSRICSPVRTSWFAPNFLPHRDQKPRPYSREEAFEALARLGASTEMGQVIVERSEDLKQRDWAELVLLHVLGDQEQMGLRVREVYCCAEPVFEMEVEYQGTAFVVHLGFLRPGFEAGSMIGPYSVSVRSSLSEEWLSAFPADSVELSLLKVLARLLPRVDVGTWQRGRFPGLRATEALNLAGLAWTMLGANVWPGSGRIGEWDVIGSSCIDAVRLVLRLQSKGGVRTELLVQMVDLTLPEYEEPDGFLPVFIGNGYSLHLRFCGDIGGDILSRHLELESLRQECISIGTAFQSRGKADGSSGLAGGHQGRQREFTISFTDLENRIPQHIFRIANLTDAPNPYKQFGAVGVRYDRVPMLKAFKVLSEFVFTCLERFPVDPTDAESSRLFASRVIEAWEGSRLASRFCMTTSSEFLDK